MENFSDDKVVEAWLENAEPWSDAVRGRKIESRRLVTDAAIVEAVMSRRPASMIDIGCGEGWLVRALSELGISATGFDVVPELIQKASASGAGNFRVASYEELASGSIDVRADVVVANFSLIGRESVERLLRRIPEMMEQGGSFIMQTPHPLIATGDVPYEDGWREGSWDGCGDNFKAAAPWYFRTVGSWVTLISESAMRLAELREPLHPATGKPSSLILIAEHARGS
jgi:2-polyprenyl-3-methyl-5-hydroxy-6-metoxy-1,4-benzoquinol methylase